MVFFDLIAEVVPRLLHLRIALDTRMTLGFLDHMISLPVLPAPLDGRPDDARRLQRHGPRDRDEQVAVAVIDGLFVLLYAIVIFYVSPMLGFITIAMAAAEALVFARPTFPAPARRASTSRRRRTATWSSCSAAWRRSSAPAPSASASRVEQPLHRRAQRHDAPRPRAGVHDAIRGAVARSARC